MYTVVLMAALSSGSAAPDWHRHGGCHGAVTSGCYGCYGGYSYTGGGGVPYGGTCIGTYGGYSVYGPAPMYGCWGCWGSNTNLTVYSGPGTYGYGSGVSGGGGLPGYGVSFQCHGCYGCYGGWSCYGSPTTPALNQVLDPAMAPQQMVPGGAAPSPQPLPVAPMSRNEDNRIRSKVVIEVPENAKLFVDDNLMKDGGTQRVFQTPPLNPNETYFYEIRVEVMNDGKVSSTTQRLVVRPGDVLTANFRTSGQPEIATASGILPPR